jgi:hypothetical protein
MSVQRQLLNKVFALFLGLIIATVSGIGGEAVYPSPATPAYSSDAPSYSTEVATVTRDRNLGAGMIVIAGLVAVAGVRWESVLGVLGNGMLLGGAFSMLGANGRYLAIHGIGSKSFAVPFVAAVLSAAAIAAIGYWKFTREPRPEEDSEEREQFEGFYSFILAISLVYAFSSVYVLVWLDLLKSPDFSGLAFAAYSVAYTVALAAVALLLSKRSVVIANGALGAAFLGLFAGVVTMTFDDSDMMVKFAVISVAMAVTAVIGYLKFIRGRTVVEAPGIGLDAGLATVAVVPLDSTTWKSRDPFERAPWVIVGETAEGVIWWSPRTAEFSCGGQPLSSEKVREVSTAGDVQWYPEVVAHEPSLRSALAELLP